MLGGRHGFASGDPSPARIEGVALPTRIASTFADLKSQQRIAFMPFLTAGDPDMQTTLSLIREFATCGVDLIEVGFPYSDPIADGPVIQASYARALENGLHVEDIFSASETLPADEVPPLVAMVSYAIVFKYGSDQFLKRAKSAGFSGLIVPDLPGDEAADLAAQAQFHQLDLVPLVSPTTPDTRAERILRTASGFVYCISVAGTTGVREVLPDALADQLRRLRNQTDLPLAVGFGISKPQQIESLHGLVDGVIVGSAIVRRIYQLVGSQQPSFLNEIRDYLCSMVAATELQ